MLFLAHVHHHSTLCTFNGKNVKTIVTAKCLIIISTNLALYNPWNFEPVKRLIYKHYAEYGALEINRMKLCYAHCGARVVAETDV